MTEEMNVYARLCEELKISQAQFAQIVGVTQPTVSRWCQGKSKPTGLAKREVDNFIAAVRNTNVGEN